RPAPEPWTNRGVGPDQRNSHREIHDDVAHHCGRGRHLRRESRLERVRLSFHSRGESVIAQEVDDVEDESGDDASNDDLLDVHGHTILARKWIRRAWGRVSLTLAGGARRKKGRRPWRGAGGRSTGR